MSATEPVEQIHRRAFPSPFTSDLPALLRRLADLPPARATPYLTLMLDWRPDGTHPSLRTGKLFFQQEVEDRIDRDFAAHTTPHESLSADIDRIREFLGGELDSAVHGIVLFACSANGVFEPALLGAPLTNQLVIGPTPALRRWRC